MFRRLRSALIIQAEPLLMRFVRRWLVALNSEAHAELMRSFFADRSQGLPPAEALRYLFRIDDSVYWLEAEAAVAHDDGIHAKHRLTRYHDFFVNRLSPGESVLDLGCGNGALSADMAERAGARVIGIDMNEDNIATARNRHAHAMVEYRVGDALRDLPDATFDVVVMSNVLEHLPDRSGFLKRLTERLHPSRFLIRVPLFERDWRVPLRKEVGAEWRLDVTHETEYTLESFADEMAAAGLCNPHLEVRWGEIWTEAVPHRLSDR